MFKTSSSWPCARTKRPRFSVRSVGQKRSENFLSNLTYTYLTSQASARFNNGQEVNDVDDIDDLDRLDGLVGFEVKP